MLCLLACLELSGTAGAMMCCPGMCWCSALDGQPLWQ